MSDKQKQKEVVTGTVNTAALGLRQKLISAPPLGTEGACASVQELVIVYRIIPRWKQRFRNYNNAGLVSYKKKQGWSATNEKQSWCGAGQQKKKMSGWLTRSKRGGDGVGNRESKIRTSRTCVAPCANKTNSKCHVTVSAVLLLLIQ